MALLFFAYLALVLARTHGHFSRSGVLATTLAVSAYGAVRVWRPDWLRVIDARREQALSLMVALFVLRMAIDRELLYADVPAWTAVLRSVLIAAAGVTAARAWFTWRGPSTPLRARRPAAALDAAAIAMLLAAQFATLVASPHPRIDVVTMLREAMDVMLSGHNPYVATYTDIYGTGSPPPVTYFPGVFWLLLPFHVWPGDFRAAYVAGSGLTALGLYRLARDEGHDGGVARLWALAWLSFPVSLFVLEQGWVESLLIPLAIWSVIAIRREQWIISGLLIGYACAIKPTVAVLAWFAVLAGSMTGTAAVASIVGAMAATWALVVLPFVGLDARAFYDGTIGFLLRQPLSPFSHSLPSFVLVVFNRVMPPWIGMLVAAGLMAVVMPRWMRRQAGHEPRGPGLGTIAFPVALSYVVSFLVLKNAYANYYVYAALFVLIDALSRSVSARPSVRTRAS